MPCPRALSPGIVSPNLGRAGDSGSTSEDAATLKACAKDPDIDPVFRKPGRFLSHKKNSKNCGLCTSPNVFGNEATGRDCSSKISDTISSSFTRRDIGCGKWAGSPVPTHA